MKIAPGIYQLKVHIPNNPLDHVNCYLIEGSGGWVMVDTGWYAQDSFTSLETGLKGVGLTFADIVTIIITHIHPDHFGLAGRIKHMLPKVTLLTHRWESDLIELRYSRFSEHIHKMEAMLQRHGVPGLDAEALESAFNSLPESIKVTFPDRTLYGGETITTGIYNLEVIWTPGHSPGHICLYEPVNRLLFSGDHILQSITPNVSYNTESGDNPLGDYIHSLRKLQNLRVAKVLPAHGNVFANLRSRIEQIISHHNKRVSEIQSALNKELCNAYDIASQMTWNVPALVWEQFPPQHKRFAVTETIAHLEYMRWEGKVQKIVTDSVVSYRLV